jgi:hypothetical protein
LKSTDYLSSAMGVLVSRYGTCRESGDEVYPCGYHEDRVGCAYFELPQVADVEADPECSHFTFKVSPQVREAASLFRAGCPPAGSWALVHSQRTWLGDRLRERLQAPGENPVRLLVAGVASYVHFLGLLLIVDEALASAPGRTVDILVVDGCVFPLRQIERFEALARGGRRPLFGRPALAIPPSRYTVPKSVSAAMARLKSLDRIELRTKLDDLSTMKLEGAAFDVIADHFVSSMYHKSDYLPMILQIRSTCFDHLERGGALLSADGYANDHYNDYPAFVEEHRRIGFVLDPARSVPVWDPYGLAVEDIAGLADKAVGEPALPVHKGNMLSCFVRPR